MPTDIQDPSLDHLSLLAADYRGALDALDAEIGGITRAQRAALRKREHILRRRLAQAEAARVALVAAVRETPAALFKKRRTLTRHGVKFGWRKLPGSISHSEPVETVAGRIRRKMADREDVLVRVKTSLVASALRQLTASELASIGVEIHQASDQVVAAGVGSNIEREARAMEAALKDLAESGGEDAG